MMRVISGLCALTLVAGVADPDDLARQEGMAALRMGAILSR